MRPAAGGMGVRWGAAVAMLGAVLAVVGAFMAWAHLLSTGSLVAPVETTVGVAGVRHWTGLVALAAAGVAALGAIGAGIFEDAPSRRQAALVATAAGLVALVAALIGFGQREAIATTGLPGGDQALAFARDFVAEFNRELGLSIPPPRVDAGPGVFLAMVGGALGAMGGVISLRNEAPHRRGLRFGR
jgi:hypothetical protein